MIGRLDRLCHHMVCPVNGKSCVFICSGDLEKVQRKIDTKETEYGFCCVKNSMKMNEKCFELTARPNF